MATQPVTAVSPSNAIGAFELTPRRLCDLGVLKDLRRMRSRRSRRMIWIGKFVDPKFGEQFKTSLELQYGIFSKSIAEYASKILNGEVKKPEDLSMSGALSMLHRAGPKGLESSIRFEDTKRILERTNGIF
jgi:hypothetical protein